MHYELIEKVSMFRITIKTTLSFVRLHAPGYSFSFLLPSNLFLAA